MSERQQPTGFETFWIICVGIGMMFVGTVPFWTGRIALSVGHSQGHGVVYQGITAYGIGLFFIVVGIIILSSLRKNASAEKLLPDPFKRRSPLAIEALPGVLFIVFMVFSMWALLTQGTAF